MGKNIRKKRKHTIKNRIRAKLSAKVAVQS